MTITELLKKIGVSDEQMGTAEQSLKDYLNGDYVPKSRFNEVNEKFKTAESTIVDRDKQLTDIKKNVGDNEELKKRIETLQSENKASATALEEKYKALQIDSAIKLAIATDAQDVDIVSTLIDKNKLVVGEDGNITAGLSEQLEVLRKDKSFLFVDTTNTKKPGYTPNGGASSTPNNPFAKETFNLTEQGRMLRDNPEQAKALANEAGVTL